MQGRNDFFVYTRAYATFRAKVIKITYRSMAGQFLGKITSWEKATAVLQKKKKGYKNPLKRIKDKEKDTHGKRFNAPFVCVLMAEREGFEPSVRFGVHTISNRALSASQTSLHWYNYNINVRIFKMKKHTL